MPAPKTAAESTPIVTFYSYKGGVGRSMAVLNVAALVASRGFRVLIIDFDLEAPGLSHLVLPKRKEKPAGKSVRTRKGGLVELLSDAKERGLKSHLFAGSFNGIASRYTFSYEIPKVLDSHPDARLSIMPAGIQDDDYSARLHRLNLAGLYEEGLGKPLIEHFRQRLIDSGRYDHILIDSRTGHSDEAGICTRDLADHRMVVSGLNTQNIEGTAAFLRSLRAALLREKKPLKNPDIILSPVPNSEDDLIAKREKAAGEAFTAAWGSPLTLDLLIPYHPRLALTEEAYVPTITASPLRNAYLSIEDRFRRSLGHSPAPLHYRFLDHLRAGNGAAALTTLRRWIKLSRSPGKPETDKIRLSPGSLSYQPGDLLKKFLQMPEALEILELWIPKSDDKWGLDEIAKILYEIDEHKGRRFTQFLLMGDFLEADELGTYADFLEDVRRDPDAAEAFYKRAIEAGPKNARHLGNYGVFLQNVRRDPDGAEGFYKRAIEADPKDAHHLGNYALFLQDVRKDLDAAEAFYKRAIDADPKNADYLDNYTLFLQDIRQDLDGAEALHKRAIDADPKNADRLGHYALFLQNFRRDPDAAEAFYKRAIDADPKHTDHIGNYAVFLQNVRQDSDAAEAFYKRDINARPKDANSLGNYGQFLLGRGRVAESLARLRSAWEHLDKSETMGAAELCFSLWLGSRVARSEEAVWEQAFKFLIGKGFIRSPWNFDAMLVEAAKTLDPVEMKYAKALAKAFLDESKVAALEKLPRWRKIVPLDPTRVGSDGTIRNS